MSRILSALLRYYKKSPAVPVRVAAAMFLCALLISYQITDICILPDDNINYFIYGLFAICVTVVIAFLVHNLLFVTQRENLNKKTGLLKLGGFSASDIKKYYFANYLICSVLPVAAGSVIGCLTHAGTFFRRSGLAVKCILISFSVCLAVTTYYRFVKPCGLIKNTICDNLHNDTGKCNRARPFKRKIKNPALLYAVKKFITGSDVTTSTAIMIFASVSGILISVFIADSLAYQANMMVPVDYTVYAYDGLYDRTGYVPNDPFFGLPENEIDALISNGLVQSARASKRMSVFIAGAVDESGLTPEEKEAFGFSADKMLSPNILSSFDDDYLKLILDLPHKGKTGLDELNSGKYVIAVDSDEERFHVGDTLNITQRCMINGETRLLDITVTVAAVYDFSVFEFNSPGGFSIDGNGLVWGSRSFDVHGLPVGYHRVDINIKKPENAEEMKLLLTDLTGEYETPGKSVFVSDYIDEKLSLLTVAENIRSAAAKTALLLFFVSFFEILINLNLSILHQKNTVGALRAIDLKETDYAKTLILQLFIQVGYPLVVGGIIAVLSVVVLNSNIFNVPPAIFPVKELLICISLYFISSVSIAVFSSHRFFKIPVSECVK